MGKLNLPRTRTKFVCFSWLLLRNGTTKKNSCQKIWHLNAWLKTWKKLWEEKIWFIYLTTWIWINRYTIIFKLKSVFRMKCLGEIRWSVNLCTRLVKISCQLKFWQFVRCQKAECVNSIGFPLTDNVFSAVFVSIYTEFARMYEFSRSIVGRETVRTLMNVSGTLVWATVTTSAATPRAHLSVRANPVTFYRKMAWHAVTWTSVTQTMAAVVRSVSMNLETGPAVVLRASVSRVGMGPTFFAKTSVSTNTLLLMPCWWLFACADRARSVALTRKVSCLN